MPTPPRLEDVTPNVENANPFDFDLAKGGSVHSYSSDEESDEEDSAADDDTLPEAYDNSMLISVVHWPSFGTI